MGRKLSREDFSQTIQIDYRLKWMLHDIDTNSALTGLEIGALDNPTVLPEEFSIQYVDYAPTETLQTHPHEATVSRRDIVTVDHVWAGSGSLAEICGKSNYDFVLASHVIEHVPNVLGWFQGIHAVVRDGGIFNLAIPDRRFTFDFARKCSTLGEMVEAALLGYRHPSIRQMFDHTYEARAIEPGSVWHSQTATCAPRYSGAHALDLAMGQARAIIRNSQYFDSHCWVFTPDTFLSCMIGATEAGLFDFVVNDLAPTRMGDFEFFVSFRRDDSTDLAHRVGCLRHVANNVAELSRKHRLLAD